MPCGRSISAPGALTCDDPVHRDWQKKYAARFSRLSYPGVRRVIRRQTDRAASNEQVRTNNGGAQPTMQVYGRLPAMHETPGDQVVHTFRAKSIYCLQTVQWACGVPVGWGKCYKSESAPQVVRIINWIWRNHPQAHPGLFAYDNACDLLRHLVTQNQNDPWLTSTKFIVDAWHYIGHQATDVVCRLWCNPAPSNGSQPDLIRVEQDESGQTHKTRAFNTETAEQFNSWLSGYEPLLCQMTASNYDFAVHVLMMLYKETVEARVVKKGRELTEEFWDEVD